MDYGLLSAVAGKRDWQAVKADRMMQLQAIAQKEAMMQKQVNEQAAAQQGLAEYFNELQKTAVLEQDQKRVYDKEKQLRQQIFSNLGKYNGDVKKYLLSGGAFQLNEYKNDLLASDELVQAKGNALNNAQANVDRYLGRDFRPIVEKDAQGNDVEKTWDDVYSEFSAGKRKDLPYNGSVQPFQYQETFSKRYFDKNDRTKGGYATAQDVYLDALAQGAQPFQAKRLMQQYQAGVGSGQADPYTFKTDDIDWGNQINRLKYYGYTAGDDKGSGKETGLANITTQLFFPDQDATGTARMRFNEGIDVPVQYHDGTTKTEKWEIAAKEPQEELHGILTHMGEGITYNKDKKTWAGKSSIYIVPRGSIDAKGGNASKEPLQTAINFDGGDSIISLNGFVRRMVPTGVIGSDGKQQFTEKNFILAKVRFEEYPNLGEKFRHVDNDYKIAPAKSDTRMQQGVRTITGKQNVSDYQAEVLIPVNYNEASDALLTKDLGLQKSTEGVEGMRMNINDVTQAQAQAYAIDGTGSYTGDTSIFGDGIKKVDQSGVEALQRYGYDKVIAAMQQNEKQSIEDNSKLNMGAVLEKIATDTAVPMPLLNAIFKQESDFNPYAISAKGAMGISQLMPRTADSLKVKNPFDAVESMNAGAGLVKQLVGTYKLDWNKLQNHDDQASDAFAKVLAAYNWGAGNVQDAVTKYGQAWYEGLPQETVDYIASISNMLGLRK